MPKIYNLSPKLEKISRDLLLEGSMETKVSNIPKCQIPGCGKDAYADAQINSVIGRGQWGYVCKDCFNDHKCQLGLGKGQKLIKESYDLLNNAEYVELRDKAMNATSDAFRGSASDRHKSTLHGKASFAHNDAIGKINRTNYTPKYKNLLRDFHESMIDHHDQLADYHDDAQRQETDEQRKDRLKNWYENQDKGE